MKNILIAISLAALTALAAETNIPAVVVTADAQTTKAAEIHDVLRTTPGVLVSSQGGAQNDLSIRGSSFSGAGLALGGLPLRNPQTEHFHAELPLPAAMLSRPEVLTGLANQGGHLTGTVHFDLLPVTGRKQAETGFGDDQRDWQNILLQQMITDNLGVGFFAGRETAAGVDYSDNDYDRDYAGGHMQYRTGDTQIDFLAAHQEKEFGARGYYGVNSALPADEKTEDTLAFLSAQTGDLNADYLRAGAAWREFCDDYELPSLAYRNQHRSRTASAFFDGRTMEVNGWALGWRTDAEEERVASDGSTGGLGFHHRTRGGLSLLPQWRGDRLKITAGARGEFFTDESPYYLPQAGLDVFLSDNLTAFAAYTETVRLPSYTELNYNSPASLGNAGLDPQTEQQTEFGLKGIPSEKTDWKLTAFHRRSHDTADWIRTNSAALWEAKDIGEIDVFGTEASAGWYPARNVDVQLAYTWIYKDKEAGDYGWYASRYALDYPEHLVQGSLFWRPAAKVELGTTQALRWQTDNPVREGSDSGVLGSLFLRVTPHPDFLTFAVRADNLWDDDFQEFPVQRPPGRLISLVFSTEF